MIKPQDVDFSSPEAALLSTEAQRFQGYDLEAEGAAREVIEEHEDYVLVQVTLPLGEGTIKRTIQAFKNGEVVEQPDEPVIPTPTPTPVLSYSISGPTALERGATGQYAGAVVPADADVTSQVWDVDNGEISQDGIFTPATKGMATIGLVINDLAKQTLAVEVLPLIPTADVQPVTYNVAPNENALNEKGKFLTGKGFGGEFATAVNDKVIELALAPAKAGVAILGPSVDGVYPSTDGEVSVTFAVTALGDAEVAQFNDYDIKLLAEATEVMSLVDGVWVGKDRPDYVLTDSFESAVTVQNATRQRFLVDAGFVVATTDEEIWQLTATHKTTGATLEAMISVPKSSPVEE